MTSSAFVIRPLERVCVCVCERERRTEVLRMLISMESFQARRGKCIRLNWQVLLLCRVKLCFCCLIFVRLFEMFQEMTRNQTKNGSSKWNKRVRDNFVMPFVWNEKKKWTTQSCREPPLSCCQQQPGRTSRFDIPFCPPQITTQKKNRKNKRGVSVCVFFVRVCTFKKKTNQSNKWKTKRNQNNWQAWKKFVCFSNVFFVFVREIQKEAAVREREAKQSVNVIQKHQHHIKAVKNQQLSGCLCSLFVCLYKWKIKIGKNKESERRRRTKRHAFFFCCLDGRRFHLTSK